jgi:hypothetical protein
MIESRNIGRTGNDFQCRVRIINGLFAPLRFQAKWTQVRVKKTPQASAFLAAAVSCADRNFQQDNASVPVSRNGGAGSFSSKY